MFHKVKAVYPSDNYELLVLFISGVTKTYDVKPLFEKIKVFNDLKQHELFYGVYVDIDRNGIIWNDDIDLSCEELWTNGKEINTPFDGLIAMSDATYIWHLNESTLRKAISYGHLKKGIDVSKYGKQWVVSLESMIREYGLPDKN